MKSIRKLLVCLMSIALVLAVIPATVVVHAEDPLVYEQGLSVSDPNAVDPDAPVTDNTKVDAPTILGELSDKRTINTKYFSQSDRTTLAVTYPVPIHYTDADNMWQDYDNTLIEVPAPEGEAAYSETDYTNRSSDVAVRISKTLNEKKYVRLETEDHTLSWYYQKGAPVSGEIVVSEKDDDPTTLEDVYSEVDFKGVFRDVDLQYIVGPAELKENLILQSKEAVTSFVTVYQIGDLEAVVMDQQTIEFRDKDGKAVYELNAPYMRDDNGVYCNDVRLEIVSQEEDTITVKTVLDEKWLQDKDRTFPVLVDPVVYTNLEWWNGNNGCDNVYVSSANPNTRYYNSGELFVGNKTDSPVCGKTRSLVKLSSLPDIGVGGKVTYAEFNAYIDICTYPLRLDVHKVTSYMDWSVISWNQQPSYDSAVSDYQRMGYINPGFEYEHWYTFNITDIVQSWYDYGDCYGIMLRSYAEDRTNGAYVSILTNQNNYISTLRPTMVIAFRNMTGLEGYWSYTSLDSAKNGSVNINNYNGNLTFVQPLTFDCGGELMPLGISAVYNTTAAYHSGDSLTPNSINTPHSHIGNHFQTNFHLYVRYDNAQSVNNYKYYLNDADGTKHWFYFENFSDTTGKDEDGLGLTLTVQSAMSPPSLTNVHFTIEDQSHNIMKFNDYGYLILVQNAAGVTNSIVYEYEDNTIRIQRVMDGANRAYIFDYDTNQPDLVTKITDPASRDTCLYYDSTGNLTSICYPDGQSVNLTYNSTTGYLTTIPGPAGSSAIHINYLQQSSQGRVSSVSDYAVSGNSQINRYSYSFSYSHNMTRVEDMQTQHYVYQFNDLGQTIDVVHEEGGVGQFYGYVETTGETDVNKNKLASRSHAIYSATNFLVNAGFTRSLGNEYWIYNTTGSSAADPVRVTDHHYITDGAVKVSKPSLANTSLLAQTLSYLAPGDYTLSGYVNTDNTTLGGEGLLLGCEIWDSQNTTFLRSVKVDQTVKTDGWERREVTFHVNSGERLRVKCGFEDGSSGTAYFDDLQLEQSNSANSYNLVENAHFRYDTSRWTVVGGTLSTGNLTWLGTKVATFSDPTSGGSTTVRKAYQEINASGQAGDVFSFGSWLWAQSVPAYNSGDSDQPILAVRLYYYNEYGQYIEQPISIEGNHDCRGSGNSGWQMVAGKAIIPANYSKLLYVIDYTENLNTLRFAKPFCYKEEFGQTYTYDENGNVISAKDLAQSESTFSYYGDRMAKMVTPTGSHFSYTYNDYDTQRLDYALSSSGQRYSFAYNDRGGVSGTTISAQPVATILEPNKEYYIINAFSGQAMDCGLPTSDHTTTTYRWDPYASYQKWSLRTVDAANKIYEVVASGGVDNRVYLDVKDAGTASGVEVQTYFYNNNAAQHFKICLASDNTFYIATGTTNYSMVLTTSKTVTTSDHVRQQTCDDINNLPERMRWYFYEVSPTEDKVITSSASYSSDYNFVTSETNALNQTTSYTYDSNGNVSTVTAPNGVVSEYVYTAAGSKTSTVQVKENNVVKSQVGYTYSGDLLTGIARLNGSGYGFTYDALGRRTAVSVTNGNSSRTLAQYAYTDKNQLQQLTYGNGDYVRYFYDSLDRETAKCYNNTDQSSPSVKTVYNPQGLVARTEDYALGSYGVFNRHTYDLSGRLVKSSVSYGLSYDAAQFAGSVSYRYEDKTDRLISTLFKLPGYQRLTSYTYGSAAIGQDPNTVYAVGQDNTTHLQYTYDALGRRTTSTLTVPGKTTSYTYSGVTGTNHTSTQVRSMTVDGEKQYYYYDDVGNLLYVADANGNPLEAYTYDALGQLTGATIGSDVYAYTYDANGNILTATKNNVTKNYGYTDSSWSDLLTSYNGYSFTYDAIGNPLQYRDGYTMTWVNGRQLNSVNLGNNQTVGFSYNAGGQRLFKNSNSKSVMYLVVDGVAVGESINNGQTTIYYLFDENGDIYGITVNGTDYFFRKNLQGDVVGIWNANGTQVVTYTYDPWGKLLSMTDSTNIGVGTLNPFRYRSYYYDIETGLYYLQSRYYDPEICRFVNADGLVNGVYSVGLNQFAYCLNNPVNFVDVDGQNPFAIWASSMWWLTLVDGPIPVGDIVYCAGIVVSAILWVAFFDAAAAVSSEIAAPPIAIPNAQTKEKAKAEDRDITTTGPSSKNEGGQTYYHVTTLQSAALIISTGVLRGSNWEAGYVYAFQKKPNVYAIDHSGAHNGVIISFTTYASFVPDTGITDKRVLKYGPVVSASPGPVKVQNATIVQVIK